MSVGVPFASVAKTFLPMSLSSPPGSGHPFGNILCRTRRLGRWISRPPRTNGRQYKDEFPGPTGTQTDPNVAIREKGGERGLTRLT